MLQSSKLLQSPSQFLNSPKPSPSCSPQQLQNISISSPNPPICKQTYQISRRELTVCAKWSLFLLVTSHLDQLNLAKAIAEEIQANLNSDEQQQQDNSKNIQGCLNDEPTKRAFLDISIDREPKGRIVIGLYGDSVPTGAKRFSDLVTGAAGISYRRKEFIKITPNFVQHGGVRSYGVDAEMAKRTGTELEVDDLVSEWEREKERCTGTKNLAGTVAIIVRDPLKPPPKIKLVARGGKFEIKEEEVGTNPNGTEFVITTRDSPELDASALVVGRVLEGMDVVEKIGQVKTVQENTSSPYFKVAKLIGDKRAVVAERGFNRPYSKVVVGNCGLLD